MKRGKLSIIIGRLKGKTTTTTQAFRYPIGTWTAAQAREHCQEQKGSFEAAQPKKETEVSEQTDYVQAEEQPEDITCTNLEDLWAIEEKERTEKMHGEVMFSSATSFDELEAHEQAQEAAQEVRGKAAQFQMLVNNIMSNPDVDNKAAALGALATEFTSKVGEAMSEAKEIDEQTLSAEAKAVEKIGLKDKLINAIKSVFETDEPDRKPGFTVWKEADGTYRWFAVFSNKYRDRDNPPEILSDAAHKEFVDAVDAGDWPYPKLWLWHIKGSESGYADWLAYDDEAGFNCASGVVADKQVAEKLAGMEDLLVSHGMPVEHIKRDKDDLTIITSYRSVEISPLPSWAAANELTDFALLKEADNMAIPEEKWDFLRNAGLSDDKIAEIEAGLKQKAEEAEEQGLESKDAGTEQVEEQAAETETAEPVEPTESNEVEDSPLTRDEVVDAIAAAFQPLQQQLETLTLVQAEQAKTLKELLQTDQEKVAEKASLTPAASLAELVAQRVIGSPEAKVDGRKKLAKSGPKETEPTESTLNPTPINFINKLLAAGQTVN